MKIKRQSFLIIALAFLLHSVSIISPNANALDNATTSSRFVKSGESQNGTVSKGDITVRQGQKILEGDNSPYCSLTVLNNHVAYTALHCSANNWNVGSAIYDTAGKRIGAVASIANDLDVVKITLDPSIKVSGSWVKRSYSTLKPGAPLQVVGSDKKFKTSYFTGNPLHNWLKAESVAATMYPDNASIGSSGGAVVDQKGYVVGVNVGFLRKNESSPRVGTFIPFSVIDSYLE